MHIQGHKCSNTQPQLQTSKVSAACRRLPAPHVPAQVCWVAAATGAVSTAAEDQHAAHSREQRHASAGAPQGRWQPAIQGPPGVTAAGHGCSATVMQPQYEPWPVSKQVIEDVVTMFKTLPYEYDYWVDKAWVKGTIPKELKGTYLRNGAGLQVNTGQHQRHFLDGDGCVLSLAFPGDGAPPRFSNKYVRTKGFVDEQASGKLLYRNAFTRGGPDGSKVFNPIDLDFKNVANTGVLYWAGRLWALWEVGRPYELCPRTLNTIGESSMDGQISQRLAGHYRIVHQPDGSKRAILFGTQVTFSGLQLEFYEMDESGKVVEKARHQLAKGLDIMFVHDMLVTEHWYIIVMGPVKLDLQGFVTDYLQAKRSLAELLLYAKEENSQVFLYPRPGVTPPAGAGPLRQHVLQAPACFCFHHVNAYERAGGSEVVLDTISWQDTDFSITQYTIDESYYHGGCRSQLYRLVAHLPTSTLRSSQQLLRRTVEFPAYNTAAVTGKPYRYAYFTADAVDHSFDWSPAQAVLKVTLPLEDANNTSDNSIQASSQRRNIKPASSITYNNIVLAGALSSQAAPLLSSSQDTPANSRQQHVSQWPIRQELDTRALQQQQQQQWHDPVAAHVASDGTSSSRQQQCCMTPASAAFPVQEAVQYPVQEALQHPVQDATQHLVELAPDVTAAQGVTCEEWRPGQRSFPQEPIFVPRPGAIQEDDGWLILYVHNAESMHAEVAILDAQKVSEGPVAIIYLPHALLFGLHGTWTDEYLGPDPLDSSVPAWRVPNAINLL